MQVSMHIYVWHCAPSRIACRLEHKLPADSMAEVLALLERGHNDAAGKIGPGVVGVKVAVHPEHSSRCLVMLRSDGSEMDFSYRKCC
jgi:Protein of unknown function (DUF3223)